MKQYLWLIIITIWLTILTWNNLPFWRAQYEEAMEKLCDSQARALRYARELRAVERKERIVSIKLIEDEPVAPRANYLLVDVKDDRMKGGE